MATQFTVNNNTYNYPNTSGNITVTPRSGAGDINTPVYIAPDGVPRPITHYDGNAESASKIKTEKMKSIGSCYFVGTETLDGTNKELKIVPSVQAVVAGPITIPQKITNLVLGDENQNAGRVVLYDGNKNGHTATFFINSLSESREYYFPDEDGDIALVNDGNDYAEFRKTGQDIIKAGQVVKEVGDGTLELATKRLERGCEIVSDVYAFAIGESKENVLPIAAAGRVLAYPDADPSTFEIGAPVCSGENGTVSQMSEEEERMYPSRIIGTVSEIPTYEIWNEKVPVDGRIWICVR